MRSVRVGNGSAAQQTAGRTVMFRSCPDRPNAKMAGFATMPLGRARMFPATQSASVSGVSGGTVKLAAHAAVRFDESCNGYEGNQVNEQ
jgi:hypothetical protein